MDKYEQWKETEKALNLAIKVLVDKRNSLGWTINPNGESEKGNTDQYDSAIRELQRCVETPK